MSVNLKLTEDIEVEAAMKQFYVMLGLTDEEAARKVRKFEEYVFRVKGIEPARETLIDHIIDEIWWVGVWFAMEHRDKIVYDKNAPDEEEPKSDDIAGVIKSKLMNDDEDLGGMFG